MFYNKISFRIGLWYASAILLSFLLLFGLTAFLLTSSLQRKDRVLLNEKVREYTTLFQRDGVRGLQLKASAHQIKDAQSFVVKLSSSDGKTLFIHAPDRSHDLDALTLSDLDGALQRLIGKSGWNEIRGGGYGDHVEVISSVLPSGETLQVGKDTEDREEFLRSFTHAYLFGSIPILALALLIGGLLSNRLLRPIRVLTQTVENIRSGNSKARVDLHKGKDELWRLGVLFNQMLEQNEKLNQAMRDTLDNVAHDLRTPLTRMQIAAESALIGKADAEAFKEALIDCRENSGVILGLLNGVMDITAAETGNLSLKREQLDASRLVEGVIDLYGFVAEEKGISLAAKVQKNFSFSGDRTRLSQALSNLVDNALKYSPSGTAVTIEVGIEGDTGVFKVSDQGSGIPETEQPKIWDRLYRVDSSRSQPGTGLGLSLVKAIVTAHGGAVSVKNNLNGAGSTFEVQVQTIQSG